MAAPPPPPPQKRYTVEKGERDVCGERDAVCSSAVEEDEGVGGEESLSVFIFPPL